MGIESKLAYRHWLKTSFEWETIRMVALAKAEYKCRICQKRSESNDVHHLWYRKKWDETEQWDVVVLCRDCHARVHELTEPGKLAKSRPGRDMRKPFWKAELAIKRELGMLAPKIKMVVEPKTLSRPLWCGLCQQEPIATSIFFNVHGRDKRTRICLTCWTAYLACCEHITTLFIYSRRRGKFRVPLLTA